MNVWVKHGERNVGSWLKRNGKPPMFLDNNRRSDRNEEEAPGRRYPREEGQGGVPVEEISDISRGDANWRHSNNSLHRPKQKYIVS